MLHFPLYGNRERTLCPVAIYTCISAGAIKFLLISPWLVSKFNQKASFQEWSWAWWGRGQ